VSIFKPIALASALAFQSAWSPASAANVYGIGSIDTNLGFPLESFDADYEAPDFLDVAKIIQLNGSEAGGNIPVGNKSLSYFGDARFGRLSARSHIGGQVPASPDLSTSVQVSMGFSDQIAVQNLNPLAGNNLRLDVALGGEMTGYGATDNGLSIGKLTSANFSIRIADLEYTFVVGMADIGFAWFGPNFLLTNTSQNTSPRFTPYPGEEPGFTQNPTAGPPSHFFGTRGYIDIPLFYPPFLALGESFVLEVDVTASSSCGNETPECLAITRFSTARIDNARLVDQNGDAIPGAIFTSTSGYDYVTAPVPEPETWALMLAAVGALGSLGNRAGRRARSALRFGLPISDR
jgi:hypothetical protein